MNLEKQILKRLVKTLLSIFLSLPLGHFLQSGSLCIAFVVEALMFFRLLGPVTVIVFSDNSYLCIYIWL